MTQFEKIIKNEIKCDICGEIMHPVYGGGWENDRVLCANRECQAEIVYPTSTEVPKVINNKQCRKNLNKCPHNIEEGFYPCDKCDDPFDVSPPCYEKDKQTKEEILIQAISDPKTRKDIAKRMVTKNVDIGKDVEPLPPSPEEMQEQLEYRFAKYKIDDIEEMKRKDREVADVFRDIFKIADLESENARLREWIDDLQSGMYINCVYCGHKYGPKENIPCSMADVLKKHVEVCTEHPMYKFRMRVKKLLLKVAECAHGKAIDDEIDEMLKELK